MKVKKFAKEITERMGNGALDASLAASFNMSKKKFFEKIEENKKLKKAYELGLTKREAYHENLLLHYMHTGRGEKDIIKIYYSHFLNVIEKKESTKIDLTSSDNSMSPNKKLSDEELKKLAEKKGLSINLLL